jgi:GNAT superfamily N-acetyltransferase
VQEAVGEIQVPDPKRQLDRVCITGLGEHPQWIKLLARWHFDQWGPLTGASTIDDYTALLTRATEGGTLPCVLVASADETLLGSVSLVGCDLPLRRNLTPWLAQLFVEPSKRRAGVGAMLVRAVLERAEAYGYRRVYLYTSGTLPDYYARLGWREIEGLDYLGKQRTVMDYGLEK